jgi:hypothetical protein
MIDSFLHSKSILQHLALIGEDWPQEEGGLTGRGGLRRPGWSRSGAGVERPHGGGGHGMNSTIHQHQVLGVLVPSLFRRCTCVDANRRARWSTVLPRHVHWRVRLLWFLGVILVDECLRLGPVVLEIEAYWNQRTWNYLVSILKTLLPAKFPKPAMSNQHLVQYSRNQGYKYRSYHCNDPV